MEETDPLLAGETRSELSLPPLPPAHPEAVDGDAKNLDSGESVPSMGSDSKGAADADQVAADDDAKSEEPGVLVPSAGKKEEEHKSWFLGRIFRGRGSTGSGDASTSCPRDEHVMDITPPSPSPTTAAPGGGVEAEARKGFPSRFLAALLGRGRDEKARAEALLRRAQAFAGDCRGHVQLTRPTADLAEALGEFAAAPSASTAASLAVAADALAKIAGSDKLEEGQALVAQQLSTEAADLAAGRPGAQPSRESSVSTCSKSPEVLFYIAIPSSLGLLPYLNTTIPKDLQVWVGYLFGAVFSAATVGAILVARGRDHTDREVATIVGAVCFTAFSCLVLVFLSFALAGGNIVLMGVLAVILALVHVCVWAKK